MDGTTHDLVAHAGDHPGYGTFIKVWAALVALTGMLVLMSLLGQTFAVWGLPSGPYLFVPLVGPTTVRDGTGLLVRIGLGPVGYIPDVPLRNSLYGVGAVDLRAQALGAGELVDTAALDRYLFIRNAYLQRRNYLIHDGKPPRDPEDE